MLPSIFRRIRLRWLRRLPNSGRLLAAGPWTPPVDADVLQATTTLVFQQLGGHAGTTSTIKWNFYSTWLKIICNQAGQIFTFGGVCSMDQKTRTNKLHSMWLEVPSLRDMAWEALLHYLPDVGDLPSRSLVLGGVPNDLVKSLQIWWAEFCISHWGAQSTNITFEQSVPES